MDTAIYSYDNETVRQISHIDFDIWGNDSIKKASALGDTVGIDLADLYDNSEPKKGGLIDPRLGTIGNDSVCATCGMNTTFCVGHFGHINLAEHVFHVGYIQTVHKILSCICTRCSKLLIHKNEDEIAEILKTKTGKERLSYIKSLCKSIAYCQKPDYGCGSQIPKIKIEFKKTSAVINMIAEINLEANKDEVNEDAKKKLKYVLTPDIISDILKNISDEDCLILGIDPKRSRPEDMIHKIFPVPPVQMRPSTKGDFMGGSTMEDDLTHGLSDIVKSNLRIIKNKENQNEVNIKYNIDHTHLLQYHVAKYFDNESLHLPKAEQKGKPVKGLSERLKSKEGRIRGNLMGKRGDFTARTVITSDPTISNNQLGVPVKIAMNLTFPEVVTQYNIEYLSELVKHGRDSYPGANFVFPASNMVLGKRILPIDLRYRKEKIELRFGDIVERHLKDGDIVLLNRQPTLHKQSMMGHRIKVINDPDLLTYRLSVAITTPYNADFDGDEMNIFVPQSLQTQIELEEIAGVERQIITPTTSNTIVGIVQDGLLGAYNLTSPSMRIDWRNAMNIMSYTTIEDFSSFKKDIFYTGHELYSLIVPSGVSTDRPDLKIKIKNGKLLEGRLTKKLLGSKNKNNLVQLIWDAYGIDETRNFIDNTQKLVNNFNLYNGFSAGIGDAHVPKEIVEQIDTIYNTVELKVEQLITEVENNPDLMQPDIFELKLYGEIDVIRDNVSKIIMNSLAPENKFNIMALSGSKGDASNMGQMCGGLGLQAFEGKLPQKKYNKRTLSYFHQNDDRCASRGVIRNPFINGLEFPEFVFHLLASRLGVIEGAIKTAETGYAQRKLVKSLEDIMVKYDGTVRTANDLMLQVVYGDSGTDTTKQYQYTIQMIELNNKDMEEKYKFTSAELKNYKTFNEKLNEKYFNELIEMRNLLRNTINKAKLDYIIVVSQFMLPCNLRRIIDNIMGETDKSQDKIDPEYIINKLESIILNENTSLMCMKKSEQKDVLTFKNKDDLIHKTIFKIALFDALSPKRVLIEYKMNKFQFDKIIDEVVDNFNKNIIESGEMAGVIAAQSMGEQLTQFTLNSLDWAEIIIVEDKISNIVHIVPIGGYIDNLLYVNKELVQHIQDNVDAEMGDTYYLDIANKNIFIPSVNEDGNVMMKKITAITKHLPMNKDGTNTLLKVKIQSGKTVIATKAKSFLTKINDKIVPIRGDELTVGMFLPVINNYPNEISKFTNIPNSVSILSDVKPINSTSLTNVTMNDIYMDEIISIEEVKPVQKYVYDFTVEDTKTFCIYNGICCMDSFHHSGIASVSATLQGVPRIKELLSVSKNPKKPQMVIYLTDEFKVNQEFAHKIASHIKYTTLGDIRGRINVYYDPFPKEKDSIMEKDHIEHVFYAHNGTKSGCNNDINGLPWLLRIEMDRDKMLDKEVTLLEIKSKFCSWWEKRFNDVKSMRKEEKVVINKITQLAVLSNSDNDNLPIIHIRFNVKDIDKDKDQFNLDTINIFIDYLIDKFKLKGINSITEIAEIKNDERIITFDNETGDIKKNTQTVIYTSGVNMIDIRYLIGIDVLKTISNDVVDAFYIFGIEVARKILLKEIMSAYSKAGGEVNYQHISLIVDLMTTSGFITSIDRHGMNKSDTDPLSRASFEKSVEQLLSAAVFGETDYMKGISSRIMVGAVIKGGTGYCNVILDTDMIEKSEMTEDTNNYTDKFIELSTSELASDIKNNNKTEGMFIPE